MNSSPPRRASRSVSRSAPDSAAVTVFSSSSPMRWPSVSLTFLKRSRSMNSTPTRWPLRLACAIACVRRSCSSSRLGSPVSASRVARYCRRSSAWMRDDTSCTNDRIDTIWPSSSSSAEWYHSHQIVLPSLRWLRVRPVARGSSPPIRRADQAGERLRGRPRARAGCRRAACPGSRRCASRRCSPPAATSAPAGSRGPTPAPPAACC